MNTTLLKNRKTRILKCLFFVTSKTINEIWCYYCFLYDKSQITNKPPKWVKRVLEDLIEDELVQSTYYYSSQRSYKRIL